MTFLHNAWYVAGFAEGIAPGKMLVRRILDHPLLVLRRADGTLLAMLDRCPHRLAPLSLGTFDGNTVTFGYHGLGFGGNGACAHNPHGPTAGLRMQVWPVRERDGLVWVWPGQADASAGVSPPRYRLLDETTAFVRHDYIHGKADYRLIIDNILDLGHIAFLHPALGKPEVRRARVELVAAGETVTVTRAMKGEILPAGIAAVSNTGGRPVNRTLTVT